MVFNTGMDEKEMVISTKEVIKGFLEEDIGIEDCTTNAIVPEDHRSKARIIAKADGIIAGHCFAKEVFLLLDKDILYKEERKDGEPIKKGDVAALIEGKTRAILTGERVALNILQRLSGIATVTRAFVEAVEGTRTKILDTRKTSPGLRYMERYAVRMGGGNNHRFNLSEMALIKENHIAVAGSIKRAVELVKAKASVPIEVEVRDMKGLREAFEVGVDRIMLDNWDIASIKEAVLFIDSRIPIEVSGNMDIEKSRKVAQMGVDFVSVGAITHSFKALDLSLLHERA